MSFDGWALTLNGVTVTFECDDPNPTCPDLHNLIVDGLDEPPDGLDVPGLRVEDITFAQRDGVKHYNDWYEARQITAVGTLGPADPNCDGCENVRKQRAALLQAWSRSCCDVELVVYTPCDGQFEELDRVLGPNTIRRNLIWNPSLEEDLLGWSAITQGTCRTYPVCVGPPAGNYKRCYTDPVDGLFEAVRGVDGGWVGSGYFRLLCDAPPSAAGAGLAYGGTLADPLYYSPIIEDQGLYTVSAYLRSNVAQMVTPIIRWLDEDAQLIEVTTGAPVEIPATDTWTRVSVTDDTPDGTAFAQLYWVTTTNGWTAGAHLDIDGVMLESGAVLGTYFDGDTTDLDEPVVGGLKTENVWDGDPHDSESLQQTATYEENLDRSLYGPFGIVGRPRIAKAPWLDHREQVAEFILRFDATDQRMYVLDECGTPGFQKCRTITPGIESTCRSYELCYTGSGRCYSEASVEDSVPPVTLPVLGTERVYPLIVLNPGLTNPRVENVATGEFIEYRGNVDSEPIHIDTKEGTAFTESGDSVTHLLGGSIFLSVLPGNTDFRMFSQGPTDTGTADICWRDTVLIG